MLMNQSEEIYLCGTALMTSQVEGQTTLPLFPLAVESILQCRHLVKSWLNCELVLYDTTLVELYWNVHIIFSSFMLDRSPCLAILFNVSATA